MKKTLIALLLLCAGLAPVYGETAAVPEESIQNRIAELKKLKAENPAEFERVIRVRKQAIRGRFKEMKEQKPEQFRAMRRDFVKSRRARLENMKQQDPQAFQRHMERRAQKFERWKEKNPERFQRFMEKHPKMQRRFQNGGPGQGAPRFAEKHIQEKTQRFEKNGMQQNGPRFERRQQQQQRFEKARPANVPQGQAPRFERRPERRQQKNFMRPQGREMNGGGPRMQTQRQEGQKGFNRGPQGGERQMRGRDDRRR